MSLAGRFFLKVISHWAAGTTQPILCCVGQSVAGCPTQFLMERALASAEVDWRVITVEVAADKLGSAMAGMLAMKFMAVRFFPSLQSPALEQIATENELLRFIGGVTSAAWTPAGWQVWHHWGLAIVTWGGEQVELPHTVCWLHGDSVRTRSTLVALHQLAKEGTNLPSAILWTDPPQSLSTELTRIEMGERVLPVQLVANCDAAFIRRILVPLAMEQQSPSVLLIGDDLPQFALETFPEISHWLVVGGTSAIHSAEQARVPQLLVLNETEQLVTCEAYDFHRWTGVRINSHLLQDAHDEYWIFS